MTNLTIREARQLAFEELFRSLEADQNLAIDRHFPEDFANTLSRLEVYNKHLFRPNTYLHKWWARRCGSTFRTILKQFVVNPELRDYYAPGGLEGRIVLDPMMGGGTTLHEAIRLGANVIGADIDPIPVIQARASLSAITLSELQLAFDRFFDNLYGCVGRFFQTECPECSDTTDLQYVLHGLRKRCDCGEVVWDGGVEVHSQTNLEHSTHRFWLIHGDSSRLPVASDSVDFVVTDPPYYDNVQYSDLAAYFRVWLAHLLPDEIDWHYDENRSAVATKSDQGDTSFLTGLSGIFRECARVLKPNKGRLVFTFHHWDPNAWAELGVALQAAGFRLVNAHVVFSENPVSVHINNLNAIQHDTILVLEIGDEAAIPHWVPLDSIDTSDSATFCWQCGAALGWMLESNLTGIEMRTLWKDLLQDRSNGKTPR